MKRISAIAGGAIAVATVGAMLAPSAGAATMKHRHSDTGTLRVCTVGNDRAADIDVDGRVDKDADLENRECAQWRLPRGTYEVEQEERRGNEVQRVVVRGPGRGWDFSRDNEVEVQVRRGMTTTVIFINKDRHRFHHGGWNCHWCGEDD